MSRHISLVMALKFLGAGITFLVQIQLARALGVADYGIVTFLLTVLAFSTLIARCGFDNAGIRFFSAYRATKDWGGAIGFALVSIAAIGLLACLIAAVLVFLSGEAGLFPVYYAPYIPLLVGLLPLLPLQGFAAAILRGTGSQAGAEFCEGAFRQTVLLIGITATALVYGSLGVADAMTVYLVATACSLTVACLFVYRGLPGGFRFVRPRFAIPRWTSAAAGLWLTGALYMVMAQIDILMLGWLTVPEAVGAYSVASRLTGILGIGLASAAVVVAPKLSELHSIDAGHARIQRHLTDTARFTLLYMVPGTLGLLIFGQPILSLFGEGFAYAYLPLVILTAARVAEAAAGPVGHVLNMRGRHWLVGRAMIVPALLNIALNYLLIPEFGSTGAAVSTLISYLFWNATLVHVAWTRFGLDPTLLSLVGSVNPAVGKSGS